MPSIRIRQHLFGSQFLNSLPAPLPPFPDQIIVTSDEQWQVKPHRLTFSLPGNICFPIYPSKQIISKIVFNEVYSHFLSFHDVFLLKILEAKKYF